MKEEDGEGGRVRGGGSCMEAVHRDMRMTSTTSHGSYVGEMSLASAIPLPHHEAGRDITKKVGITILPDMAPASLEVLSALRS